jgi:hypothetical protein
MVPLSVWNAGPLPTATQDAMLSLEEQDKLNADEEWLEWIKREQDLAKAVKSDNAEVPIHIWDEAIFRGEASEEMQESTRVLRMWCVRVYRRCLLRDILHLWPQAMAGSPRDQATKCGNQQRMHRTRGGPQ